MTLLNGFFFFRFICLRFRGICWLWICYGQRTYLLAMARKMSLDHNLDYHVQDHLFFHYIQIIKIDIQLISLNARAINRCQLAAPSNHSWETQWVVCLFCFVFMNGKLDRRHAFGFSRRLIFILL